MRSRRTFKVWSGECLKCNAKFRHPHLGRPRFCLDCERKREMKRRIRYNEALLWSIVTREVWRAHRLCVAGYNPFWRSPQKGVSSHGNAR